MVDGESIATTPTPLWSLHQLGWKVVRCQVGEQVAFCQAMLGRLSKGMTVEDQEMEEMEKEGEEAAAVEEGEVLVVDGSRISARFCAS